MSKAITLVFLSALFFAFPLRAADRVNQIVAIVGEDIILSSDIAEASSLSPVKMTRGQILETLINEQLIQQEIKRLEIQVTPEELSQSIGGILQRNQMTLPQLKKELINKGTSYTQYKADLTKNIQRQKFMGRVIYQRIVVSDDEIENYKKAHKGLDFQEAKRELYEHRGQQELERYLIDLRRNTYIDILSAK